MSVSNDSNDNRQRSHLDAFGVFWPVPAGLVLVSECMLSVLLMLACVVAVAG